MLRVPVGLFHTFLAAGLATAGAWYLVQSELNLTWELGFYGVGHPMTLGALFSGVLGVLIAAAWAAGGILHIVGTRFGAVVVVIMSGGLLIVSPLVMKIVLGVCLVSAVFDLLPALPEPSADDDDD